MKDLKIAMVIAKCWLSYPAFEKGEIKIEENKLLLKTPTILNQEFKSCLDEEKAKAKIVPDEVYVNESNLELRVFLGKDLLALEVQFQDDFDFRSLRRVPKDKRESQWFERVFIKRYNKCCRELARARADISTSWNARVVGRSQVERVLSTLEEEYTRKQKEARNLPDQIISGNLREGLESSLSELQDLIVRLREIYKGHY